MNWLRNIAEKPPMNKAYFLMCSLLTLLFLFWVPSAFSEDFETRTLIDKSFVRDNSYCVFGKSKLEIEIRGLDQFTAPQDAGYGEHIFLVKNGKRTILPINERPIGRYRLLTGTTNNCTKSLMLKLDARVIFFFLKDSRPFLDTLSAVIYTPDSGKTEVVETTFGVVKAIVENNQLKFSSAKSLDPLGGGKVKITGKEFLYVRKKLAPWYIYDGKSFTVDPESTFKNFQFNAFFKGLSDFTQSFEWDKSANKFKIPEFSQAVRHATKESCLSIGAGRTNWRCK